MPLAVEALRGRHVAITGATGFLGRRLAAALVSVDAHVIGFGRQPQPDVQGMRYERWDIVSGPLPGSPHKVDAVAHCAGMVTDWGSTAEFFRCHVEGTRNVLASFPDCPIVHVSTASVYDAFAPKRMVREDAAPASRFLNAYAESKAAAEAIVRERDAHIILRPHAIYGPGDRVLLPRLLDALVVGHLIAVGDGRNMISLTHVDNLVDALMLALAASITGSARGVFNIADARPLRLDEVLNAVLTATGHRPRIHYLPRSAAWFIGTVLETLWQALGRRKAPRLTRYRVAQVADEYTLDCGKAAAVLGYAPTRNLSDYLAAAYGWSAPVAARRTSSTA